MERSAGVVCHKSEKNLDKINLKSWVAGTKFNVIVIINNKYIFGIRSVGILVLTMFFVAVLFTYRSPSLIT